MKKSLLLVGGLIFTATTFAQQVPQVAAPFDQAAPADRSQLTGLETMPLNHAIKPNSHRPVALKAIETEVIAESFYDLMTNGSIQNRTVYDASNGNVTSAFTWSNEASSDYTDRGAGYNFRDNGTWGAFPTGRIETSRHGWPSLMTTGNGTEVVVSHPGTGPVSINMRSAVGSGAWTESTLLTNTGRTMFWPRAVVGGANNNSVHLIALTAPTGLNGSLFNGLDGALLYFRSTNEGANWDILDVQLPGLDSANFTGIRSDSYSIYAEGNTIAVAVYNQWQDMMLFKSTDNGDTWTSTVINDFPIDKYQVDQGSDVDGDGLFDTITTCDESGALLLDDNGMAHVWFGNMRVLDSDTTDDNTSFFPGTNGLMYWNETMPTGGAQLIASAQDIDGSGQLEFAGNFAQYFTSLSSHPSAGKSANGTLFLTYNAYMENFSNGSQNFRHIYAIKSNDGGATWNSEVDITPDINFDGEENMFASLAPVVDDKLRMVFMRDFEPGLAVRGDMDPISVNELVYLEVDSILGISVNVPELVAVDQSFGMYPNPATNFTTIEYELNAAQPVSIRVIDILGQEVMTIEPEPELLESTLRVSMWKIYQLVST